MGQPGDDTQDILGMSDEDFLNMPVPGSEPGAEVEKEGEEEVQTVADEAARAAAEPEEETDLEVEDESSEPAAKADEPAKPAPVEQKPGEATGTKETDKPAPTGSNAEPQPAAAPNYEAFYKQVMAPFKANGKQIELKSPEEAIALMQMGANYTRKMQDLVPHRKVLMMLENNGLLDEGKLSFLIDIEKKNPEAIRKLVKDAGIDPLDIDTSKEPAYVPGNHQVADAEVAFRTTLQDLASTEGGTATIQVINSTWDQASKELLWKNPEIMVTMNQQRESGIYDRIVAEVERQRLLRTIPETVPFLHAYKLVGDEMVKRNAFADLVGNNVPAATVESQQPVATRVVAPKPAVANNDKAKAATPARSTPRQAKVVQNPLAMADEDFLKQFQGRL